MDEWLMIVSRQLSLYSVPVLVSLTLVVLLESRLTKTAIPSPFFAIKSFGTWMPLLAAIAFHRGIIIALPNSLGVGIKPAAVRFGAHSLLCLLGFLLFSWSLSNQVPTGLPSLQHWWAKVLMYFNLCMAGLHLLPLPGLLAGECLANSALGGLIKRRINRKLSRKQSWLIFTILAASPLLDLILGAYVVFPIYTLLSDLATNLFK